MNYEKAYKEALERAKKWYNAPNADKIPTYANRIIVEIFPELKESEDERIRKALITFFQRFPYNSIEQAGTNAKEAIAWLEKQDEKKVTTIDFNAKDWYVSEVDGKIHDMTYNPTDKVEPKFKVGDIIINIHYRWDGKHRIREITDSKYIFDSGSYIDIKEQNSWELANKVEPKFKVGDWIANDYCTGKVIALTDDAYLLDSGQGIPFSCEHNTHLWTIQDAKDGDVLACGDKVTDCPFIFHNLTEEQNPRSYCGINTSGDFQDNDENGGFWCKSDEVRPATKEQRDLLFQKIREAGYEWDAEKKELKKIHVIDEGKDEMDYCFTKMMAGEKANPTWSEDDEDFYNDIIKYFSELDYPLSHDEDDVINWLKSIKERLS